MTGVVHVLERVRLGAAGREEGELGVQVGVLRQVEHVSQGPGIVRSGGDVHAVVEHDHQVREPLQEGRQLRGLVAVDADVDDEVRSPRRLPESDDAGMVEPSVRRLVAPQPADVVALGILREQVRAVRVIRVERADAGHPVGVGPDGIDEEPVIPAVERRRLDR